MLGTRQIVQEEIPSAAHLPLAGISVLDLGVLLSSPFAARALGDLGADILKIETLQGDPMRAGMGLAPEQRQSKAFLSTHRNRQALAVDLKTPEGLAIVHRLVEQADVVVENFRAGVPEKLKIDYETLRAINPRIIYCAIRGFPESGKLSHVPVTDAIIQGFVGMLEFTGDRDGPGLPYRLTIADMIAGATAAQAVSASLLRRERTGLGAKIELNMLDSMMSWLHTVENSQTGVGPPMTLLLPTSDGKHVVVQPIFHFYDAFVKLASAVPGHETLATDPRFATLSDRIANLDDYMPLLESAFRQRTQSEWVEDLARASVPSGPVHTLSEALNHPEMQLDGSKLKVSSAGADCELIGSPFRIDGQRLANARRAPWLGENTDEVLANRLHLSSAEIDTLREAKIVK